MNERNIVLLAGFRQLVPI